MVHDQLTAALEKIEQRRRPGRALELVLDPDNEYIGADDDRNRPVRTRVVPRRITRTPQPSPHEARRIHLAAIAPTEPDTLCVQQRASTLSPALLAAISAKCPTLGATHDEQLHYAA